MGEGDQRQGRWLTGQVKKLAAPARASIQEVREGREVIDLDQLEALGLRPILEIPQLRRGQLLGCGQDHFASKAAAATVRVQASCEIADNVLASRADQRECLTFSIGNSTVHAEIATTADGHKCRPIATKQRNCAALEFLWVQGSAQLVHYLLVERVVLHGHLYLDERVSLMMMVLSQRVWRAVLRNAPYGTVTNCRSYSVRT